MSYSSEPVYITKDGQRIPYIPETITNAREAYAASMHVLFRHVSDFHLCVVKVFSEKYGIPEDDIMSTIHESTEFKKLTPDPALDELFSKLSIVDLEPEPEPEPELKVAPVVPNAKKRRVVKKKPDQAPSATTTLPTPAPTKPVQPVAEPIPTPAPVPVPVPEKPKKKPVSKSSKYIDTLKTPAVPVSVHNVEPENEKEREREREKETKKSTRPIPGAGIQQKLVFKQNE
jgi:hypothetical protein